MRKIKAGSSKVGKRYAHSIGAMAAGVGGRTSDVMKMRKRGGFNDRTMSPSKRYVRKSWEVSSLRLKNLSPQDKARAEKAAIKRKLRGY